VSAEPIRESARAGEAHGKRRSEQFSNPHRGGRGCPRPLREGFLARTLLARTFLARTTCSSNLRLWVRSHPSIATNAQRNFARCCEIERWKTSVDLIRLGEERTGWK